MLHGAVIAYRTASDERRVDRVVQVLGDAAAADCDSMQLLTEAWGDAVLLSSVEDGSGPVNDAAWSEAWAAAEWRLLIMQPTSLGTVQEVS